MRALLRLAPAALCLLVALPVSADAPLDQYEDFTRFDQRITDAKTKLQWERRVPARVTFADATNLVCQPPTRLPTVKELLTLVDEEPHDEYVGTRIQKMIDPAAFPDTPVDVEYWTSTTEGTDAFTVSFADGTTKKANKGDTRYTRCVEYVGP